MDKEFLKQAIRDLRAERRRVEKSIAEIESQAGHVDDHDLERHHLGMVTDETELARIEEHLLWCAPCIDRAEVAAAHVDAIRAGIIIGNFDMQNIWHE